MNAPVEAMVVIHMQHVLIQSEDMTVRATQALKEMGCPAQVTL